MAFPSVVNTATTDITTDETTYTVNMPASIVEGNTLLSFIRVNSNPVLTWPAGWTVLFQGKEDDTNDRTGLAWKKATSSEGSTMDITQDGGGDKAGHIAWEIQGAADPTVTPPEINTTVKGNSTTPDPGDSIPTGTEDFLWVWLAGRQGDESNPPSGNPTDYTSNIVGAGTGTTGPGTDNCNIFSATRQLNASSEDAGSWDISPTGRKWAAWNLAVHPAAVSAQSHEYIPRIKRVVMNRIQTR